MMFFGWGCAMRRCSETIGEALNFAAALAPAPCVRASIFIRVECIAVVAILLWVMTESRAMAADIGVPGTPPSAPFSYYPATAPVNWGGIYFGVNGGYGFGSSNWTNAGVSTGNFPTSGAIVGGTAGLNYAGFGGGLMFGVEGDLDWSALKGSSSTAACVALGASPGTACETKSEWLSTARGRVGYVFDRFLIFATAGAAIGDFQLALNPPAAFRGVDQIGWTAGGGVEFAFTDSWTAKIEYLYVDLGTFSCPAGTTCALANAAGISNGSASLNENIVRAGVNYKFSW